MLLSIIIPSFQQALLLRQALRSIEQQTFNDYEILVMDGGSKDETVDVINEFEHLRILFHSAPDEGIYDAMNKGIAASVGDYLYFMGCDDTLVSSAILDEVFSIPSITSNAIIYGDVIFTGSGKRFDGEYTYFKLYMYNICHQAIFTHRKVFAALGNFDIRYKAFADWHFNMRWFDAAWIKRIYVPVIIANYNTAGYSSNLKDETFFAEQAVIKQQYFPIIVRYLAVNQDKFIHRQFIKVLTTKRIMSLNFLRQWLE